MRKNRVRRNNPFRILTVDDDQIMTSTIQAYFQRNGYEVDAENDPTRAIERVRNGNYDIMLLDFLMTPICGNQVVEEIRKFDKDLYIILLTGHKSMAPPVKTIRELEIQGYYEKSTRFDQLELLVESCTKSIDQIRQIRRYEEGLSKIIDYMTDIYKYNSLQEMADGILAKADDLVPAEAGFILFETEDKATVSATKGMEEVPENREGFYLFPVMDASHKQVGMIGLKYGEDPETARLQLLKIFVRQAAAALVNRSLHFQLNEAYQGMISTLRYTVEARDEETRGHSDRVSKMAAILSEKVSSCTWTKLFRRTMFDRWSFPEGRFYEDHAVIYRIAGDCRTCVHVDRSYYYYFQRADSICHTGTPVKKYHFFLADYDRIDYISKSPLFTEQEKDAMIARQVEICLWHMRSFMKIPGFAACRREMYEMRDKLLQICRSRKLSFRDRKSYLEIRYLWLEYLLRHIVVLRMHR